MNQVVTKEEARKAIEHHLEINGGRLPAEDEILFRFSSPVCIVDLTFLGLLCIAYDLTRKEDGK